MAKLCVSLSATDIKGVLSAANAAREAGADLVEVRLDSLRCPSAQGISRLRRRLDFIPAIATLRPRWEGGSYTGGEDSRNELLEKAVECGFGYVDIELGMDGRRLSALLGLCRKCGVGSIVSHHDHAKTPGTKEIVRDIERCTAAGDIGKVAYMARSSDDSVRIIKAAMTARNRKKRFIALGMGGHGRITRLLGPFIGSAMVYACLASEKRTAEGQPRVGEIVGMWSAVGRRKRIGPSTGLYGLIGHPLGHSLSPLMHNAAFRKLGMDAVYLPFDVEEEYLEGTVLALKASGFRGANVTIPYKESIIPHLDRLDETARKIGAVNTIKNEKGMLTGFNTDVFGFIDALKASGVRLRDARAIVIGAGGAAKAAVRGLLNEGASVTVANRTRGRALALRRALGARNLDVLDQNDLERAKMVADIIVNCTPLGMRNFPDVCPVPEALLRRCRVVFDMVYNPVRTPLLASAEKMGARTVSGMEMFIRQGMESFRIWTGKLAPEATIRRALAYSQKR